jgi:hypothetical protein
VLSMEEWQTCRFVSRPVALIGSIRKVLPHFPTHQPSQIVKLRASRESVAHVGEVGTNAPGKPNNLYFIIIARSSVRNLSFSKGT